MADVHPVRRPPAKARENQSALTVGPSGRPGVGDCGDDGRALVAPPDCENVDGSASQKSKAPRIHMGTNLMARDAGITQLMAGDHAEGRLGQLAGGVVGSLRCRHELSVPEFDCLPLRACG